MKNSERVRWGNIGVTEVRGHVKPMYHHLYSRLIGHSNVSFCQSKQAEDV